MGRHYAHRVRLAILRRKTLNMTRFAEIIISRTWSHRTWTQKTQKQQKIELFPKFLMFILIRKEISRWIDCAYSQTLHLSKMWWQFSKRYNSVNFDFERVVKCFLWFLRSPESQNIAHDYVWTKKNFDVAWKTWKFFCSKLKYGKVFRKEMSRCLQEK